MTRKEKSKNIGKNNISIEPVPNIYNLLPQDVLDPLMDILVEMIISKVHGENKVLPINASELEIMIQNSPKKDAPIIDLVLLGTSFTECGMVVFKTQHSLFLEQNESISSISPDSYL
jgi:hypothetical protein